MRISTWHKAMLVTVLILSQQLMAQLNMTRSTFTGSYTPISLPSATLSTATGDDVAQSGIPIGFTFNYLGNNYTTVGVNTNGVASFMGAMSASGTNNNLYVNTNPNLSLAPWWDNLWSDTVLYQTQGSPGSQTFTIQWTNAYSYFNTATQQLNFQVILYETTNEIEFRYGNLVPGIAANNESASIGIEGATGGAGDYLDAVTGSAFTSNGMLNAANEWPSRHFRFTPGTPAAIAGGSYTVGLTGNYYNLSEALADINHRGISGAVSLSLIDAAYDVTPANGDNFFPMLLGPVAGSSSANIISISSASGSSTITSEGTLNGNCGNAAANNVISNANEPIFALVGANYVTLQDIHLNCSSAGVVDRGLSVLNSSATAGSQNNLVQGLTVTMNRANVGCYGLSQQAITTPTAASGANSGNTYYNLSISNVYTGIYLNGNANFPDLNCVVGTTSSVQFNMIGAATAGDIGSGTGNTATYGIRANNQSGVSIFNNEVRNLSHSGTSTVEGIVLDAGQGNNRIYMNKIHDVNYTGGVGTANVTGIRANVSNAGANNVSVWNNFIYAIGTSYAGGPSAIRSVKGIFVQSLGGGGNTDTINVDFNNVRLEVSNALNISSTCFETGIANGPVINVRNNVFANFTAAQTGIAMHYTMVSPVTNSIGNTGSVDNHNDLFIANTPNGNVGLGQTTNYAALVNWQTAMGQDANSVSADPGFISSTDLHESAVQLNAAGSLSGITWINNDIDDQLRAATPDIGADEFVLLLLDAGVNALVAPVNNGCHTSTEQVTVRVKNFAGVALDFSVDNVNVTVNVSGAITANLNFLINDNSLNAGNPLPPGATIDVPVGVINMSTSGIYTFDSYTTLTGDGNPVNDTMIPANINYTAGTAMANPTSVCAGSSVMLVLSGSSPGGTIQWMNSTDGGITWNNETGPGNTNDTCTATPSMTTLYMVSYCGNISSNTVTVNYYPVTAPTVADTTVCGPGIVNLSASGSGTIYWYANAVGGTAIASGNTYAPNVSATTTYYVSNTTGNITQGVGLYDNSAGGGMSGSNNNLIFDVTQNCTLDGVYIYPAAAGNVTIELQDNTNAVLNSVTFVASTTDIGQRTYVPLNYSLAVGTGYNLVRTFTSIQLWRNNVGVNYPYTIPGVVSITTSTAGNGFYYFFYDWQITYGCESPRTPLTVTVLTPPAITVSANPSAVCLGSTSNLSVSSGNSNYTYTWSPAGTLNTSTGSAVIATPVSTITYTVNADDATTGCRAIDSLLITVNSIPPTIIAVADTVVCSGAADTLVVSYPSQSVGLYDNSAGGNMSASVNNLIFDVFANCILKGVYIYPAAVGTVTIDLEDNTNAVLNSATYIVTAADVNNRTFVPLNFNLTPATGMQLVRNASSVNCWRNNVGVNYPYTLPGYLSITTSTAGNGFYYFFYNWQIITSGYTFNWTSVPVGFTATGDTAFVSPVVNTQYIVTVTDTLTGCSDQFTTTVNVATPIQASITGPVSICQGDSALLIAGTSGGDGVVNYIWSNSMGSNDSVYVSPASTTSYYVVASDGCGTSDTAWWSQTVNTGPPTAAFTYSITGLMTFTFTDGSSGATSWQWDFGDSQTSTSQNPTNVYSTPGTYTVTLIASNGCGSDTIIQVIVVDGIPDIGQSPIVHLFPNPAHDQLMVIFGETTKEIAIDITDLQGKVIRSCHYETITQGDVRTIDIRGVAEGMYILEVKYEGKMSSYKLIRE